MTDWFNKIIRGIWLLFGLRFVCSSSRFMREKKMFSSTGRCLCSCFVDTHDRMKSRRVSPSVPLWSFIGQNAKRYSASESRLSSSTVAPSIQQRLGTSKNHALERERVACPLFLFASSSRLKKIFLHPLLRFYSSPFEKLFSFGTSALSTVLLCFFYFFYNMVDAPLKNIRIVTIWEADIIRLMPGVFPPSLKMKRNYVLFFMYYPAGDTSGFHYLENKWLLE